VLIFFESMTEEQLKTVRNFEARVRQVLVLCDKLREENADLQSRLTEEKNRYDSLKEDIVQLQTSYDNLKVARLISASRDDLKTTKNRLSNLVREVDMCITLLNE